VVPSKIVKLSGVAKAKQHESLDPVPGRIQDHPTPWQAKTGLAGAGRGGEPPAVSGQRSIWPGGTGFRHPQVWAWLGANAAQVIDVSFNAEARGRLLDYFVQDAGPRVLIGTEDYLQILADATAFDPEYVI